MQFSAAAVAEVATNELHQEQEANEKTKQDYHKRDQEILDDLDRQREAILQEVFSEKPAEPEPARRPAGRPTQPRLNERSATEGRGTPGVYVPIFSSVAQMVFLVLAFLLESLLVIIPLKNFKLR